MSVRIWSDDNGLLTCERHAGATLKGAIAAAPRRRTHRTSLGTYEVVPEADLRALDVLVPGGAVCAECDARTTGPA